MRLSRHAPPGAARGIVGGKTIYNLESGFNRIIFGICMQFRARHLSRFRLWIHEVSRAGADAANLYNHFLVFGAIVVDFTRRVNGKTARRYRRCVVAIEDFTDSRPPGPLQYRHVARLRMPMRTAHGAGRKLRSNRVRPRFARIARHHHELYPRQTRIVLPREPIDLLNRYRHAYFRGQPRPIYARLMHRPPGTQKHFWRDPLKRLLSNAAAPPP